MQYTEEYNLKKPEITDPILVQDMNDNMDIIAEELSKRHSLKVPTNVINDGDDLDTYLTVGEFRCISGTSAKTLLNCPYTTSGFKLTVENMSYDGHIKQTIDGVLADGIWFRTSADAGVTWRSWKKVSNVEYEEGTWTPTINGCSISGKDKTYYKKVGNVVFISAFLLVMGASSTINITGLPYPIMYGASGWGGYQHSPVTASVGGEIFHCSTYVNSPCLMITKSINTGSSYMPVIIHGYYFTTE